MRLILNNKLLRILLLLVLVGGLASQTQTIQKLFSPQSVQAVGDLTVNWGIGVGNVGPVFTVNNIAPGQSDQKTVSVSNGGLGSIPVGIRGVKTAESASLSDAMAIIISRSGTDLYGGSSPTGTKTLADFFTDSAGSEGINLFTQNPGTTSSYIIKVNFKDTAGNIYQNASVTFNIHMGIAVEIPLACQAIDFGGRDPIFGTSKSERLNGTAQNDLIFGMGGSDKIDGKAGNDCIIGANGSDSLIGGNGNDVILGQGGSDSITGGAGNDQEFGGAGSDSLKGDAGDDTLLGEAGSDSANGGVGTDTCIAESVRQCEF